MNSQRSICFYLLSAVIKCVHHDRPAWSTCFLGYISKKCLVSIGNFHWWFFSCMEIPVYQLMKIVNLVLDWRAFFPFHVPLSLPDFLACLTMKDQEKIKWFPCVLCYQITFVVLTNSSNFKVADTYPEHKVIINCFNKPSQ